jgi:hypothetical protein
MEETIPKKRKGNVQNLIPLTTERAREIGAKGGQKFAENLKKRKALSEYYADYLAKANGVDGHVDINDVISAVLERGDSASVSMLKEIREATEGSKVEHSGSLGITIIDDIQ